MAVVMNIVVFLIGSMVGSFFNVCISRLPREESVVSPRSHCMNCGHTINWYDNIPFISYIALRARCRYCAARIPIRYFIVELVTALTFLILYLYFGLSAHFFAFLILLSLLIVATFTDFEHFMIPDIVSFLGIGVGLALALLYPSLHHTADRLPALYRSLLGALTGGGSIFLIGVIGKLIFRKEAMGGGDVKLMAMIGTFLGWQMVLLAFFIAPFFGSIVGIVAKFKYKKEIIPYGPYLSMATLVVIFWGEPILRFIIFRY
ncbi:MAG: prepilin peptidase [Candidatus Omnitrophica bacterium]|nr:prepilin peptidase [Candidatus Omnitrophota bacterium]